MEPSPIESTMHTPRSESKPENKTNHLLRAKLSRLLRVKAELWADCLPIPPELEAKIREVAVAAGVEPKG